MPAEQVTGPEAHHGEGPIWDGSTGRLMWVDLLRGDVLSTVPGSPVIERLHVGSVAACVAPRARGGWVIATERGFALVEESGVVEHLGDVWSDPTIRMNDGACDRNGAFYCGSMAYDAAPGRGALYRLGAERAVETVLTGVTISNGLDWSPEGEVAYYVDSPTQRIDVCNPDFSGRRPLVTIPADTGMPDGLTVDAEGGIWVALWGGGAVHRYTSDGMLDYILDVPVTQPTSCAFGGQNLDTLFVTTSALDLDHDEPQAGAVFAFRPGVRGLPANLYAG
jgi:sugar lactone lactonase YvrE